MFAKMASKFLCAPLKDWSPPSTSTLLRMASEASREVTFASRESTRDIRDLTSFSTNMKENRAFPCREVDLDNAMHKSFYLADMRIEQTFYANQ